MGRNKKVDPFSVNVQHERQRIWRGMTAYGSTEQDRPTATFVLPETPDLSAASHAQHTVMRNSEYWFDRAHENWVASLLIISPTDRHSIECLTVLLIEYRRVSSEEPTLDRSAWKAPETHNGLVIQPGFEPYQPGTLYSPETYMALYDKGTGKFVFGGTKINCERWINGHKDKHQLRRSLRVEVRKYA